VKGTIDKMPQYIDLNIENLNIGKSIVISDVKLDGITVMHPANLSIVSVQTTRNVAAEEATPGATGAAATTATATPAAAAKTAAPPKK
jgi:hypothetical protein